MPTSSQRSRGTSTSSALEGPRLWGRNRSLRFGLLIAATATGSTVLASVPVTTSSAQSTPVISVIPTSLDFAAPYNKTTRDYSAAYVAGQVRVVLQACVAGTSPAAQYAWSVRTKIGAPVSVESIGPNGPTKSCTVVVIAKPGDYEADLVRSGAGATVAFPTTPFTVAQPVLMVSVGDSYASGEGLPDEAGSPESCSTGLCESTTTFQVLDQWVQWNKKPVWFDAADHRSLRSGPAKAAKALAAKQPLTFLAYAKSGAVSTDVLKQLATAKQVLAANPSRRIDVLTISYGGNDVGFGEALEAVAKTSTFTNLRPGIEQKLNSTLPPLLQKVNAAIKDLNPRTVVWTGYPTSFFDRDDGSTGPGCGLFETRSDLTGIGVGVNGSDAKQIKQVAGTLNEKLRQNALQAGFAFGDVAPGFDRHGYCGSKPFFVSAEDSCKTQGDTNRGTMHPNASGTNEYARVIVETIATNPEFPWAKAAAVGPVDTQGNPSQAFSPDERARLAKYGKAMAQWKLVGLATPDGTSVSPGSARVALWNDHVSGTKTRFLQYESSGSNGGINLGWTDDADLSTMNKVARWGFKRDPASKATGALRYGERIAMGYFRDGTDKPYVHYATRDWGINLDWGGPVYEWTILGGQVGKPVRAGERVALFNLKHDNFMIYFPRENLPTIYPGHIGWPDSTSYGWTDFLGVPLDILSWVKDFGIDIATAAAQSMVFGFCSVKQAID